MPTAFAAMIYSSCFTLSTRERIRRPKLGILMMAMAMSAFLKDGPSTATIAIAKRMLGNASMISKNREMIVSTQRP
ncbi:Uncharacterised protein [Mycobacteroides abscessus subsp. abscessus]|nr:Uncharacterised protein [Mycobacteroides abscessus subsp. abscessus]